ncbi:hypothetical protein HYS93_00455 [Candidatus Daviesbacteria bacterium]|nr:hypothetical protein [Candidatus Daviesbacteria bacterium]
MKDQSIAIKLFFLFWLGLIGWLGFYSINKSSDPLKLSDQSSKSADEAIDCSLTPKEVKKDSSLLSSALQEDNENSCLFAGCAVIF